MGVGFRAEAEDLDTCHQDIRDKYELGKVLGSGSFGQAGRRHSGSTLCTHCLSQHSPNMVPVLKTLNPKPRAPAHAPQCFLGV